MNGNKDGHGDGFRDGADIRFGLAGKCDPLQAVLLMAADLFHGKPQIGDQLFERDARVGFEPLFGSSDGALFLLADRFVVNRCVVTQGGIHQSFQELNEAGELRLGEPVDQLMGVMAGFTHAGPEGVESLSV